MGHRNDIPASPFHSQPTLHPNAIMRRQSIAGGGIGGGAGLMRRATMMGKKMDDALLGS